MPTPTPTPTPCLFYLQASSDHASPAPNPPSSVLVWTPGNPSWRAAAGTVSAVGDGWYSLVPASGDSAGGPPMLLYAEGTGADPTPMAYDLTRAGVEPGWTAGGALVRVAWFMGTTSSDGYAPATGLSPTLEISHPPGSFAAAPGTITEAGNGLYVYAPVTADLATAGIVLFSATASGAIPTTWEMAISAATPTPTPTPTPGPTPTPTPDMMSAVIDPDASVLVAIASPGPSLALSSPDIATLIIA